MFKTGSKFLYGLAAFGWVAAFLYAIATADQAIGMDSILGPLTFGYKGHVGDHIGYAILMSLAAGSLFLALFLSALRDSDPEAAAQAAGVETVPEVPAPSTVNYWPIVGGFSAAAVVLGLAVGSSLFALGMAGLFIVTVEWAVRAWSDRATGDPEVNRGIRNRFMYPVEVPVMAVLGIALMVLAVSRILLALPKFGSYLVFGLVPVLLLAVGSLIVMKPKLSQSVVAGLLLAGGIALLAGGVAAAIAGEREHHSDEEHHSGEEGLAPSGAAHTFVIRTAD